MERQRQELGIGNTKTGFIFDKPKMKRNKKGQSLIHESENLLEIICDNFDCPLIVAKGFGEFQKRYSIFTT